MATQIAISSLNIPAPLESSALEAAPCREVELRGHTPRDRASTSRARRIFKSLRIVAAVAASLAGPCSFGASAAPKTLTSIAELRTLTKEELANHPEARLEVTVVFFEDKPPVRDSPPSFTISVFDGRDACSCNIVPGAAGLIGPPKAGDRMELEAVVEDGVFMPTLAARKVRLLAPQGMPAPRRMGAEELLHPRSAGQWAEVEGRISNAVLTDQTLSMTLVVSGHPIRAQLPLQRTLGYRLPWDLIERLVRIRCVIGTRTNFDGQLMERYLRIPSMEDIEPLEPPPQIQDLPVLDATQVLRFESDPDHPVRLRGEVLHWRPGNCFYLRTSKGSLRVRTPQPLDLKVGSAVDVVGYPSAEIYRPSLRAMRVEVLGVGASPEPVRINKGIEWDFGLHMNLVALEAELLSATWSGNDWKLLCRMGTHLIEAVFSQEDLPEALLTPGIRLALTGVCELLSTSPVSAPRKVDRLRLHLRSLEDLRLIRGLPWYKSRNLLAGLSVAAIGAVAALFWALSLRARVAAQTATIREQLNRSVILEERQRIARDWHDTTDQQLAGAGILIDSAADWAQAPSVPASIRERLQIARQILDACKRESRATIRDLNSVTLEQEGFGPALHELLDPLARSANMALSIEVEGGPRLLPIHDEHHLLRIACEAVSNAVRHSGATQIRVRLARQQPFLQLEIADNGNGFDRSATVGVGDHFGLRTMDQRARKLGGKLEIQSAPRDGTTIRIQVPPKPIDS